MEGTRRTLKEGSNKPRHHGTGRELDSESEEIKRIDGEVSGPFFLEGKTMKSKEFRLCS